jgi:hypothetical protein
MKEEAVTLITFADKKGFDAITAFNCYPEVFKFLNYVSYKNILISEDLFKNVKVLLTTAKIYILSNKTKRLSLDRYFLEKSKIHDIEIVDSIPNVNTDEYGRKERLYIIEDEYIMKNTKLIDPEIVNLRLGNSPQINLNNKYFLSEHFDISPEVYFTNFKILNYVKYLGRIESKNINHVGGFQFRNVIKHRIDTSCSMAEVLFNDRSVMFGNTWDFHNGCNGFHSIPDFKGVSSLINLIENECLRQNLEVEIIQDKTWKYV